MAPVNRLKEKTMDISKINVDRAKLIKNYTTICSFLVDKAQEIPETGDFSIMLKSIVDHNAYITMEHIPNLTSRIRIHDSPYHTSHRCKNIFYADYDLDNIQHEIDRDCPSDTFLKAFIINWHKGIKDMILQQIARTIKKVNERISLEKELENFTV